MGYGWGTISVQKKETLENVLFSRVSLAEKERFELSLYVSNKKEDIVTNLPDYQICQILSSESIEDIVWFEISCILEGGAISGYIDGTSFFQLTLAGLIRIMSNENIANYMQNYSFGIEAFVNNYSGEILRLAQVDSENTEEEEGYTYIKNIKTKKFHLPSCKSVNDIKNKNIEEYTGTRESLIELKRDTNLVRIAIHNICFRVRS